MEKMISLGLERYPWKGAKHLTEFPTGSMLRGASVSLSLSMLQRIKSDGRTSRRDALPTRSIALHDRLTSEMRGSSFA